jgi:hypothetical protein
VSGNPTYLRYYENKDIMSKLSLGLRIFLQPLLLALFLILVGPIYTKLVRLNKWVGYFAMDAFTLATILFLLMLGIRAL